MVDAKGSGSDLVRAANLLRKTIKIALVVGVILCLINIGLSLPIPARVVLNFVVPFCVSSIGVLSATRCRVDE